MLPLHFILDLDLLLQRHDQRSDNGVSLGQTIVRTLSYAEDVRLVDPGDTAGVQCVTDRLTDITKGSRVD